MACSGDTKPNATSSNTSSRVRSGGGPYPPPPGTRNSTLVPRLELVRHKPLHAFTVHDHVAGHAAVSAPQAFRGVLHEIGADGQRGSLFGQGAQADLLARSAPVRSRSAGIRNQALVRHQDRALNFKHFRGGHGAVVGVGPGQQAVGVAGGAQAPVRQHVDGMAAVPIILPHDVERERFRPRRQSRNRA